MIFWPHGGDLSAPPELKDLKYRRPARDYWESQASNKDTALPYFWVRWRRETGRPYPRTPPVEHSKPQGFSGNKVRSSRRPDHQSEKSLQDARE